MLSKFAKQTTKYEDILNEIQVLLELDACRKRPMSIEEFEKYTLILNSVNTLDRSCTYRVRKQFDLVAKMLKRQYNMIKQTCDSFSLENLSQNDPFKLSASTDRKMQFSKELFNESSSLNTSDFPKELLSNDDFNISASSSRNSNKKNSKTKNSNPKNCTELLQKTLRQILDDPTFKKPYNCNRVTRNSLRSCLACTESTSTANIGTGAIPKRKNKKVKTVNTSSQDLFDNSTSTLTENLTDSLSLSLFENSEPIMNKNDKRSLSPEPAILNKKSRSSADSDETFVPEIESLTPLLFENSLPACNENSKGFLDPESTNFNTKTLETSLPLTETCANEVENSICINSKKINDKPTVFINPNQTKKELDDKLKYLCQIANEMTLQLKKGVEDMPLAEPDQEFIDNFNNALNLNDIAKDILNNTSIKMEESCCSLEFIDSEPQ